MSRPPRELYDYPQYPGHGLAEYDRGGPPGPVHPWSMLAKGKMLGKRVVVPFVSLSSATRAQTPQVDLLNIKGDDGNAHQLCVSVDEAKIINGPNSTDLLAGGADIQGLSGEQDNIEAALTVGNVGGVVDAAATGFQFANPIMILQWGTGGVSHRCEVDVHQGQTFDVSASWLRLSAMVESAGLSTQSSPYVLAASVGPGSGRPFRAKRTMQLGIVGSGQESDVFTVPRFARDVMLCGGNDAGDSYAATIRFWRSFQGSALVGLHVADFTFTGASSESRPIEIPNGAFYFSIISAIGGLAPRHNAVFGLGL